MTTATAKAAGIDDDPELRSQFVNTLLRIAATGAMGGAAARAGLGVVRNVNPRYAPPAPPRPVVVDMPYYTDRPVAGGPPPELKEKEKVVKAAFDPIGWAAEQLGPVVPMFRAPEGNPGAQTAADVPLTGMAAVPLGIGGAVGGYAVADKIMRAAERRRAQAELDEAQKEYHRATLGRLAGGGLPSKSAAAGTAAPGTPQARTKAALDRAYAAVKRAQDTPVQPSPDSPGYKAIMSMLFPGLRMGPTGAGVNAGIVGVSGLLGGYAGYNYARDQETASAAREAIKRVDREHARGVPAPYIARLVPVQRG